RASVGAGRYRHAPAGGGSDPGRSGAPGPDLAAAAGAQYSRTDTRRRSPEMIRRPTGQVAILRGLSPDRAAEGGEAMVGAGPNTLEVPLNSPDPLRSSEILREQLGERALVGAGTVRDEASVAAATTAGAQLIVCPNTDPDVVAAATAAGLPVYPGVATVSE